MGSLKMKKNLSFVFFILQFAFCIGKKNDSGPFIQSSFMEWTNIFENLSNSESSVEKTADVVVSPERRQGQSEKIPLKNGQTFSNPIRPNNPFTDRHPFFMPPPPWHQSHNFLRFNPTSFESRSPNSFFWISEDIGSEKLSGDIPSSLEKVPMGRTPQSLRHQEDCKEISALNLPRLARLPGQRCYFTDIFKSGRCVQNTCLEARFCRARGRKIIG